MDQHGRALGRTSSSVIAIAAPGFQKVDLAQQCLWEEVAGRGWICSLRFRSPVSMRHILVFSGLKMAPDAELVVYVPAASNYRTRCVQDCLLVGPADIPLGRLTIPHLAGDVIIVEYYQAAPPQSAAMPLLYLEAVMQGIGEGGLRAAAEAEISRRRRRLSYWQVGTQYDMIATAMTYSSVGQCTPLIGCQPAWNQTQARGVVAIYVVHPNTQTVVVCSGAILNSPNQARVFLLTADHCFANRSDVNNFGNWVVAFNYRVSGCNPAEVRPLMTDVVQGVTIKFYDAKADILLLEVTGSFSDRFKSYALGYDARSSYVPKRVVGIHHPGGDVQHISWADGPNAVRTRFRAWKFPEGETQPTEVSHFEVGWTRGVTTGGSSGSPLIDMDTGLVVGVLTGGPSSCSSLGEGQARDYYGKLSYAWAGGLHRFLSNDPPANMTQTDGIMLSLANQGSVVVDLQGGRDLGSRGPAFNYFPSHMSLTLLQRSANVTYYLTSPPAREDTIRANVLFHGGVPGNKASAGEYVYWDEGPISFTEANFHSVPRVFQVWLNSNVTRIPGGIMRFIFTVQLTSDRNSSYMQVTTMSGVIQDQPQPWWSHTPTLCASMPCNFTPSAADSNKRAVVTTNTGNITALTMTLQMAGGALPTAMLVVYCNNTIQWADSPTNLMFWSDSITMPDIRVPQNSTCALVISDYHDISAVLPMSLITSGQAAVMLQEQAVQTDTGPVADMLTGGAVAPEMEAFVIPLRSRAPTPPAAQAGASPVVPGRR